MNQYHAVLSILGLFGMFAMQGQVVIDQNFTLDQYVNEILLGEGVTASNISLIGDPIQLAKLTDPSGNFSVTNGLVLSCGDPNRLADCQGDMNPTGLGTTFNDPDLLNVANSVPPLIGQSFTVSAVNDGCVLEFDFEAGGDSISFNYVFGSDEYLAWVNSSYNDIFAFFLSGPGISGPFAAPAEFPDGAINIAEVPGSDPVLPITISSVNDVTNSEYYINNPNPGPDDICINGYTTTFTASAAVQCGETYHIKLAIADGSDDFLESVVVLEAGSFSSNAVNLEADAVPFAANGLQNLVPYEDALGLPAVFSYPNGESFPFAAWSADNEMTITVDGQESVIDAVIIEGCNDAQFTIIRPEAESDLLDTLYLGLEGTAFLGLDYSDTFNQVVMNPGQTESEITLGVVDDGADEGVEYVQITYTYINGCGEEITTTSRVVILDPLPVEVTPMTVPCQGLDGTQELGYDNVTGYGPFRYVWGGNAWNNAWEDAADWTTSFDSTFSVLNANGELVPELTVELQVIDQCNKVFNFEQQVRFPIIFDDEICLEDRQDFPALNGDVYIEDVRYNGASLITGNPLGNTLRVDATPVGERYKLNELISGAEPWEGVITLVDTCGYETEATIKVRDCVIPNVFTPNNDASNDNFRIRGLTGFGGSQLLIYNRNGTVIFKDETLNDTEFELVWGGRYSNGDLAPEGTYQWVLLRSDGYKESGPLTLVRKR